MFSKVIKKGGKLVTLTYQESWMSGGRAYWHVYSTVLSGGLCRACILFGRSEDNSKRGTFVKQAFQKLEKAIGSSQKNPGIINAHEQAEHHKCTVQFAEDFIHNYEHPQSRIGGRISEVRRENLVSWLM